MSIISELLMNIPVPKMVRIKQKFDSYALENPVLKLEQELNKTGGIERVKPGQQVAIGVGSRGVANIAVLVKKLVQMVQKAEAHPFIVPCMGSHGGATAEGQKEVLAGLGVTEEAMGAPVRSSMDVVMLDQLPNGLPVYADKNAAEADAMIVINRVKPHTAFRGPVESGIMKMISIGLGKQKGADACHRLGFKHMANNVPQTAKIMLSKLPIIFGIALVENANDQTCIVELLPAEKIEEREVELLKKAKACMPRIYFDQIDVLVIDYIGKNISGDGMDPNITGRYPTPYAFGGPQVSKMVVLALTCETEGNANGLGTADFASQRLVSAMNREVTYANGLTSTVCAPTKIATTLENDLYAIKAAIKTCNILDYTKCRLVRIKNTLSLSEIEISEAMLKEAETNVNIEIMTEPYHLCFDGQGNLF
ncbi:protein of unknown function [Desulfotomaculum arcticum]|uniref:LarA-like N-terminal domain-containing protein n=1 Tax=Desulfotruncus arcticus DSM 17038 TaxID=1121424 RepID=A0A1I2YGF6_9FIRM|nr:lactate racemase domain-containing protein [Desulfotruncus arcticus]SFH24688.1 protein of unknown function [Desulfotomaculum arcticum] [Desulfotruncus arcticus DSM 17038]